MNVKLIEGKKHPRLTVKNMGAITGINLIGHEESENRSSETLGSMLKAPKSTINSRVSGPRFSDSSWSIWFIPIRKSRNNDFEILTFFKVFGSWSPKDRS